MNGCCRVGQLNFRNGFTQLRDFCVGGSSRLFHKLTPAQALPFCERWKQSNDNSDKSRFPSTLSWKKRWKSYSLRMIIKRCNLLHSKWKRYRKNNYRNIRRPGLVHDGELVEASELLQLCHLLLRPDKLSLDFLPSKIAGKRRRNKRLEKRVGCETIDEPDNHKLMPSQLPLSRLFGHIRDRSDPAATLACEWKIVSAPIDVHRWRN